MVFGAGLGALVATGITMYLVLWHLRGGVM
jgi:hypothetical protein